MKRVHLIVVLMMLLPWAAPGQERPRADGSMWLKMDDEIIRGAYAQGLLDGILHLHLHLAALEKGVDARYMTTQKVIFDRYLIGVSAEHLRQGLDSFFADYRNRRILIAQAAGVVLREIAGTARAEIETLVERLRREQ